MQINAPCAMPIYLLGSLQYFADVRSAQGHPNSVPVAPDRPAPRPETFPMSSPPAGVPLIQGEG